MKKIIIPAILTATVLVAGMFAVIPVQNASTIHTGIIAAITATQNSLATVRVIEDTGSDIADGDRVVIDCNKDFKIQSMLWTKTNDDTDDERISIVDNGVLDSGIVIDGKAIRGAHEETSNYDILHSNEASLTVDYNTFMHTFDSEEAVLLPIDAKGASSDDVQFFLEDAFANLDTADALTVTAGILTTADATCSVLVDTGIT